MLAQNFMTAGDLEISEVEHEALIKTLNFFERGEAKHIGVCDVEYGWKPNSFNMSDWECGTTRCILGWARTFAGGLDRSRADNPFDDLLPMDLYFLCYPHEISCGYDDITVEQAAAALRNYLTLGKPHWDEVLA